ncbi:MAG: sugar phosphate isomerase/epimerase [Armatimonadetes bacterium]|nr:sugar phosphate isomerase/epimerase [Armatimonadota bacterium]
MKIGLFTALFGDKPLTEVLDIVQSLGIGAVEIGAGAYPGSPHLDVEKLLQSKEARDQLHAELARRGLVLSAISVHGNPLHPVKSIAVDHHNAFRRGVELAHALGIERVNGFSGCPGDNPDAKNPNWVTCAWPDEFRDILAYQWSVALPYWQEQADFLESKNVNFGIEMHPGFLAYNNESLLTLRNGAGKNGHRIGANFDPSHLWWQGIDPLAAVRQLGREGALFHVHAKDTRIDPETARINGNLDTKSYGDIAGRSWVFRSVGYGHPVEWWKDFVSVLRTVGYDFVLSIEHEDGLMTSTEGLSKAVEVLKQAVIAEEAGPMFWARD